MLLLELFCISLLPPPADLDSTELKSLSRPNPAVGGGGTEEIRN